MMKKVMVDSVSVPWQLLCDEHGFTREHHNQLKKFSPEVLREIIAEIACCHPSTSVLLRNKWLTPPEDILEQVAREYERRIHNCPSFRNEKEAESWLNELFFAVIVPLYRVAPGQSEQVEFFILQLIAEQERVWGGILTNDGYSWHCALCDMLFHLILRNMEDRPEHQRQRITKILYESDTRRCAEEIKFRIQYSQDEEQKRVLSELVNALTSDV
ncbi:hypothetical protein FEK47_21070 [Escherichia sp. E3659]|uniref:hypothetical protein n=1 Tax=Escherichia sp. E3659 TaxID=2044462 RepID=UPI001081978A|nr:hypothetical protein [Escherichia sp. E3659]TGB83894.1 hypothetical protein CRI65_16760 [Escherichia sp. E3659]TLJ04843.1 hypothetical protein FEK47_21070 [Escherichia sp. E3659]